MSTVNIIAATAAGLIVAGIFWVAGIVRVYTGPSSEAGYIGSVLCVPGLVAIAVGLVLAVINGFVAVLS